MKFTSTMITLTLTTLALVALMTVVAAPTDDMPIYRAMLLLVY